MRLQFVDKLATAIHSRFERDESANRLTFDFMCFTDDRRLRHLLMIHQGAFDLHRADPVSGDVHDIVDPAKQPEVAVFVALRSVTGEILSRESAPVSLHVTIRIAVDGLNY